MRHMAHAHEALMSAFGHKQTCTLQPAMSYPQKRTPGKSVGPIIKIKITVGPNIQGSGIKVVFHGK
jgi:hypothetical protein